MRQCAKFRGNRSIRLLDMWIFFIFQDGGSRHLGFLKFEIFNGQTCQEGPTV